MSIQHRASSIGSSESTSEIKMSTIEQTITTWPGRARRHGSAAAPSGRRHRRCSAWPRRSPAGPMTLKAENRKDLAGGHGSAGFRRP
ncbi:MAG: hypothetical protein MZV70_56090 [Desulfobacterales bacterium]|nr:hypothetical protein [Desulfobacterales bacterium]